MPVNIDEFVNEYVDSLRCGEAGLFVGAGLSLASGMPSWKKLLQKPAESIGMNVDKEEDLVTLAQYYVNESHDARTKINTELKSQFGCLSKINDNQKIIAQLPIDTIWTTNYDNLLEKAFEDNDKICDVKRSKDDFTSSPKNSSVTFYKMHGDISNVNEAVITRRQYEEYDRNFELYVTALKSDLVRKTFLFIGYSFQDPNLKYILSQLRLLLGNNPREHYFLIKKPEKYSGESTENFEYRVNKQRLQIEDLEQYCIKAVEVDNYEQITTVLEEIKSKVKQNHVFLSSAQVADQGISQENLKKLLTTLSYKLIQNNNVIVNGYGWHAGNAIVKGALMAIMEDPSKSIDEYLKISPFPQPDKGMSRESMGKEWTKIRQEMLDNSGIAIFISGNKNDQGKTILSSGMLEEFQIAQQKNVIPIPIGYTGGASQEIFSKINEGYESYYGNNNALIEGAKTLSKTGLKNKETIDTVLSMICNIQK
ncbi:MULTISPECIES: SIR2 family protein [Lactiplantibacillus]|uniref:SIR2 family protein n=1 Tax=Lactiplantibacillus plantarum TaxID=1590 RepID=UPI0008FD5853|nr:SIR2 family protein [Lactiplantibacillus plantarum]APD02848.1 hypothetical protein ASV54_15865 [Lactiplantibacillus plantarum]KAE9506190.1 hypothetical protein FET70_03327 [Lactiplantibacillus plantarum]UJL23488.1 SIR2 family protein [Lactiplantibacillus plantarum]